MYSQTEKSKEYSIHFVTAFDELNNRNRNLFNLSYIDKFLDFKDKKNICIINKESQSSFLYYLITNLCIYSFENKEKYKTFIVDSSKGNDLGHLYLEIINRQQSNTLYNIDNILKNIIIVRAFTFYQLANIIIKKIPKLINQELNCKIQIIILDLLNTFPLSLSASPYKNKIDNNINFNYDLRILEQIINKLIQISNTYFVILSYNSFNKLLDNIIIPKFSNKLEIDFANNNVTEKIKNNNIIVKIKSKSDRIKSFRLNEKQKRG